MALIKINVCMSTSPCIEMITSVKINLNNGNTLKGYVIWSPYDDDKWSMEMWHYYIKHHEKILFTKNVYLIKKDKYKRIFYATEESEEIKTKDILSIDFIKLEHDGYKSDSGISSISLTMAKYSKTNKPVAISCKDQEDWDGAGKCIISFNKRFTNTIMYKKFKELVNLPIESLNEKMLIMYSWCID